MLLVQRAAISLAHFHSSLAHFHSSLAQLYRVIGATASDETDEQLYIKAIKHL